MRRSRPCSEPGKPPAADLPRSSIRRTLATPAGVFSCPSVVAESGRESKCRTARSGAERRECILHGRFQVNCHQVSPSKALIYAQHWTDRAIHLSTDQCGQLGLFKVGIGEGPSPLGTKKPPRKSRGGGMEAQGIEPWSESASEMASTCVGRNSRRHRGSVTDRPPRSLSPEISFRTQEHRPKPARIFDSPPAPRTGSRRRRCEKRALAQLTQPVPDQYWQVNRSTFFSQGHGPGHAAIPSTNPSKPVAPSGG
jgi:hypothetical protein